MGSFTSMHTLSASKLRIDTSKERDLVGKLFLAGYHATLSRSFRAHNGGSIKRTYIGCSKGSGRIIRDGYRRVGLRVINNLILDSRWWYEGPDRQCVCAKTCLTAGFREPSLKYKGVDISPDRVHGDSHDFLQWIPMDDSIFPFRVLKREINRANLHPIAYRNQSRRVCAT